MRRLKSLFFKFDTPSQPLFQARPGRYRRGGGGEKGNRGNEVARILDCSGLINEFLSYLT